MGVPEAHWYLDFPGEAFEEVTGSPELQPRSLWLVYSSGRPWAPTGPALPWRVSADPTWSGASSGFLAWPFICLSFLTCKEVSLSHLMSMRIQFAAQCKTLISAGEYHIQVVKIERKPFEIQLRCHLPWEVSPHGDIQAYTSSFSHQLGTSILSTLGCQGLPVYHGAPAARGGGRGRRTRTHKQRQGPALV